MPGWLKQQIISVTKLAQKSTTVTNYGGFNIL